jgi:hypothetical protein
MSRSPGRRRDVEDLVAAYRADLLAAGMFADHPVTSVARMFFTRVAPTGGPGCRWPPNARCRSRTAGWWVG